MCFHSQKLSNETIETLCPCTSEKLFTLLLPILMGEVLSQSVKVLVFVSSGLNCFDLPSMSGAISVVNRTNDLVLGGPDLSRVHGNVE